MSVRLVGVTGSISHQLLAAEVDELSAGPGAVEWSGQSRREGGVRDTAGEREKPLRLLNTRQANNSSRSIQDSPRATVGETNSVDKID
jgi:hypothetical protein